ncbi:hypothetical protein GCM10010990_37460 [Croceicoccus mobilis]|uniref:Uncharacterized protein n=1 Tax=Croceicoccus mobilis TaxID=1703339 RepID=A0A916ZBD3_9SPHN|nr:hypothetical protein GCM10010990_37460 [Croceicoccus mobilis]
MLVSRGSAGKRMQIGITTCTPLENIWWFQLLNRVAGCTPISAPRAPLHAPSTIWRAPGAFRRAAERRLATFKRRADDGHEKPRTGRV